MDWGGPVPYENRDEEIVTVDVPDTPSSADMEDLQRIISPLEMSVHYGIDLYERALLWCLRE